MGASADHWLPVCDGRGGGRVRSEELHRPLQPAHHTRPHVALLHRQLQPAPPGSQEVLRAKSGPDRLPRYSHLHRTPDQCGKYNTLTTLYQEAVFITLSTTGDAAPANVLVDSLPAVHPAVAGLAAPAAPALRPGRGTPPPGREPDTRRPLHTVRAGGAGRVSQSVDTILSV